MTKLCSNAVFSKDIEKGQFFITLDDALDEMKDHVESIPYLVVRIIPRERVDLWKYEDRASPGFEGLFLQGRYDVEIMIESLFRDRTFSCVRIVNGINKYVTETSEEILVTCVENRGTGKPVTNVKNDQSLL